MARNLFYTKMAFPEWPKKTLVLLFIDHSYGRNLCAFGTPTMNRYTPYPYAYVTLILHVMLFDT